VPRGMEVMRLSAFVQSGLTRLGRKPETANSAGNNGKAGSNGRMVA
jgi:hypothetical protein